MTKISIIIPVFNEELMIAQLLNHLKDVGNYLNINEIIVVDGNSTDSTTRIVESIRSEAPRPIKQDNTWNYTNAMPDIKLVSSPKGRAKQMNLAAKHAKGDILYFLHADAFPPKDFDQLIINEVNTGNTAGCFRMQFDSKHWWLRLASWLTQFSWRACRGGDQSQFITRKLFDEIGGYDESYIIYEDNILINELYKRKQFVVINKKIRTSARLYKKVGVWKLQYHFWTIYVKKWFGASPSELHVYYKKHIA
jgi:rSAM/selenodomain-associated transferase 2